MNGHQSVESYGQPMASTGFYGEAKISVGRGCHFIDVTPIVRRYVLPGAEMDVENRTFGFDPVKGETKRLRLVIETPRGQFRRVYQEGDTIRFWGH